MMQCLIVILLLIGAVSAVSNIPNLAPLRPLKETDKTIAEEYIVIFRKTASEIDVQKHMKLVDHMMLIEPNDTYHVQHVYDMGPTFRGYAALMTDQMLQIVRGMREVEYVERNQWGEWAETQSSLRDCIKYRLNDSNWALSRISYTDIQSPPLFYRMNKWHEGISANIYIIDSGIDTTNPDFRGRAEWGVNIAGGPNVDDVGHGTMVAGCAMSKTYGASRLSRVIAVRIDRNGRPTTARAIAGFQWVKRNHKKDKSIANASFGVGRAVNAAADALMDVGVPVVAAAGNWKTDACTVNPASNRRVITVAASDRNDNFAPFSNFGECVDLIAPGVKIQTTGKNNANPTTTSGTSFAAPYMAGMIGALVERYTPDEAIQLIYQRSVRDKIKGAPAGTRNLLLNNVCTEPSGAVPAVCT